MFTVKQLSDLAGITPRTLHYYDEIGLLKPSWTGDNGYRYYGDESLLNLQQVLLYRELGMSLDDIKTIMGHRNYDVLSALKNHKEKLRHRLGLTQRLINTVDDTILFLEGKKKMSEKQLFEPFNEAQQAEYEKEAMQMYDPEVVKASNRKWKSYSKEEKQRIGDEGNAAYLAIVDAIPSGPESDEAQAGIEKWRRHMDYFWTPAPDQLLGLAQLYNQDPRFKANFDRIDPRLAAFMLEAVTVYVKRLKR